MAYNGTILKSRNIIGVYNPDTKSVFCYLHTGTLARMQMLAKRNITILLSMEQRWSQRCWCFTGNSTPLTTAGSSHRNRYHIFDSEDYGTPDFYDGPYKADTWCLGSQYWGRIPHTPDYKARFGILLDMVGGKMRHSITKDIPNVQPASLCKRFGI